MTQTLPTDQMAAIHLILNSPVARRPGAGCGVAPRPRRERNLTLRAVERLADLLGIDDPRTLLSETMTVSVSVTDPGH